MDPDAAIESYAGDGNSGDQVNRCSQYDDPAYFIRSCHAYEYRTTTLTGTWPDF